MTTAAVSADNIAVSRNGHTLLQGVSFDATPGELVGIVGPNGAGKSTLLGVLAGDIRPDRGDAWLLGRAVADLTLRELALIRASVGPQAPSDIVFLVWQVVVMGRHPYGDGDDAAATTIVESALQRLDVDGLAQRELRTLSTGEQQRVAIARAVAQETPVLLLDEPTSALDLQHQELVMQLLRELATSGVTVVAALHDLNLAAAFADTVLLMSDGAIGAHGPADEVFTADRLSTVYQQQVQVIPHPLRNCPLILTPGNSKTGPSTSG